MILKDPKSLGNMKEITFENWYSLYPTAVRWDCSNISWNEAIFQIRDGAGINFDTIHTSKDIFLELVRNIGVQNKAPPTQYMEELREYFSCDFLPLKSTPNNVLFLRLRVS